MHKDTERAILDAFEAAAGQAAGQAAGEAAQLAPPLTARDIADTAAGNYTTQQTAKATGSQVIDLIHSAESTVMSGARADDGTFLPSKPSILETTIRAALDGADKPVWQRVMDYLPLSPLLKGVVGLFAGSSQPEPEPLTKYAMPDSIAFTAAETAAGELRSTDYDQAGQPRAYGAYEPFRQLPGSQTINLTVNALDARSIADRAPEIAAAVRLAMLNSAPINDAILDL